MNYIHIRKITLLPRGFILENKKENLPHYMLRYRTNDGEYYSPRFFGKYKTLWTKKTIHYFDTGEENPEIDELINRFVFMSSLPFDELSEIGELEIKRKVAINRLKSLINLCPLAKEELLKDDYVKSLLEEADDIDGYPFQVGAFRG